uniref:Uncharacterized protein n=1 Tax=Parascaris equorum TaxID=6256 RepID=A0A914R6A3_PAREQ
MEMRFISIFSCQVFQVALGNVVDGVNVAEENNIGYTGQKKTSYDTLQVVGLQYPDPLYDITLENEFSFYISFDHYSYRCMECHWAMISCDDDRREWRREGERRKVEKARREAELGDG